MFENVAPEFDRTINAEIPLLSDSLLAIANRERDKENAIAAVKGGSKDFGTVADVKKRYDGEKREAAGRGMVAVKSMREKMGAIVDASNALDPADVAALAPALALAGLTDADYRVLARQGRGKRGALLAIARAGKGAYCSALAVALDRYGATVEESCTKAGDFSERALYGLNALRTGDALRERIDHLRDDITAAWDSLQAAIDGEAPTDSLEAAMHRLAARG